MVGMQKLDYEGENYESVEDTVLFIERGILLVVVLVERD